MKTSFFLHSIVKINLVSKSFQTPFNLNVNDGSTLKLTLTSTYYKTRLSHIIE